ncbi:DUF5067 domain-containing protein [Staphylococcus xylosus]|uniref:DUF5067 domain-containing protein n=1 Tax=Staphylococcus xylosus TaxID=1288 RepID=A0A418IKF6_STAXY|nr:DUF5067 domain-containing protein [Staphylococcus xylosus]RIN07749.1 DUF5067 domain-containing protein [Staphylococcus xylosus]
MKKVLGLLLASTLVLGACGNSNNNSKENKKESVDADKSQFKNDTLTIDGVALKIKDTFLINELNTGDKFLAFKYEVENNTNTNEITAQNVWLSNMKVEQKKQDTIKQLKLGPTPNTGIFENWDKHSEDKNKKEKSAKGIVAYKLQDNGDVTLKATKDSDKKELGTKKIKINELNTVDYDVKSGITTKTANTQ